MIRTSSAIALDATFEGGPRAGSPRPSPSHLAAPHLATALPTTPRQEVAGGGGRHLATAVPWLPAFACATLPGQPLRCGLRLPRLGDEKLMLAALGEFLDQQEPPTDAGALSLRDAACLALLAGQPAAFAELVGQIGGCRQGSWDGLVGRCIILELLLFARRRRSQLSRPQQLAASAGCQTPRAGALPPGPADRGCHQGLFLEHTLIALLVHPL